ncbi:uncharacterized protein LOC116962016 isoform X2 [Tyto alba]|uniref:uncharacterized protein LOC116962016 isoform X2 n=1 Tax=Tyto alba TaxID=56313 RepID=UPI001C678B84|nr:uncharacterized protein LOC116962016 isoform X2 [Tyto alba]
MAFMTMDCIRTSLKAVGTFVWSSYPLGLKTCSDFSLILLRCRSIPGEYNKSLTSDRLGSLVQECTSFIFRNYFQAKQICCYRKGKIVKTYCGTLLQQIQSGENVGRMVVNFSKASRGCDRLPREAADPLSLEIFSIQLVKALTTPMGTQCNLDSGKKTWTRDLLWALQSRPLQGLVQASLSQLQTWELRQTPR